MQIILLGRLLVTSRITNEAKQLSYLHLHNIYLKGIIKCGRSTLYIINGDDPA